MRSRFACLDALVPRVTEFCVSSTPAVSEPRTAATATTTFARFLDGTAFETHGTDHSRRACWGLHANIGQGHKENNIIIITV